MKAAPVNLDLATEGYLRTPDGRQRYVWRLGELIRDIIASGGRLFWAPVATGGYCYCWSGLILIHPAIVEEDPWRVRDVLSHELGHLHCGPSNEKAWRWQVQWYGDLIEPEWQA